MSRDRELAPGHRSCVKDYNDDGRAESWQVADFEAVHRTKTAHKVS